MMDQAKILERIVLRHGSWVDTHFRERKDACCLPVGDDCLDFWSPHEIGLIRGSRTIRVGGRDIIVRASDLVLRAVAALGKVLIAADVPTFAGFTTLARLGVTAARGTTTGTGHDYIRSGRLRGASKWGYPARC